MIDPVQNESLSKKSVDGRGFAASGWQNVSSLSLCKTTTREIEWRDCAWASGDVEIIFDSSSVSAVGISSSSSESSFSSLRSKRYS